MRTRQTGSLGIPVRAHPRLDLKWAGPWQLRGVSSRQGEFQQKRKSPSCPALQVGAWGATLDIGVEAGLFLGLH